MFIIRCPGFPSDSHACSLSQSLLFLTKPFASCCKLAGNSCVDEAESWNCSLYSTSLLQTSVLAATALLRSMSAPCWACRLNMDDQMWQPLRPLYGGNLWTGRSQGSDCCPLLEQMLHSTRLEKWHTAQPTALWLVYAMTSMHWHTWTTQKPSPNRCSHCYLGSDVSKWILAPVHPPLPEAPLEQQPAILMEAKDLLKAKSCL